MVSSSLIKPKIKRRSTLWYGRYDRCLVLRLKEAWTLRYNDHASINKIIYNRRKWRVSTGSGFNFSQEDQDNLHRALDWKLSNRDRVKIMVCSDYLYVYAADDAVLDEISGIPGMKTDYLCQVELRGQPGTISLRQSLYQNRTYLRWTKSSPEQRTTLRALLRVQTDIKISPSFNEFLDSVKDSYVCDYYYIDHNDPGILYMLELAVPGIIRKTVPITTYK